MHIKMDEISIQIVRKPIKNTYFRFNMSSGVLNVSVPLKLPLNVIHSQINSKRDWINKTHTRITQTIFSPAKQNEMCYFLGKKYKLIFHAHVETMKFAIDDECIHLFLKTRTKDTEDITLTHWYKTQMRALLPQLIEKWEPVIGVLVNDWCIRIMKTRWGSCNPVTKRLSLNLNLIKKPQICLEYVLVHEMIHLLESSHNRRFYKLMSHFMPDWRDHQKQLEEWSRILGAVDI